MSLNDCVIMKDMCCSEVSAHGDYIKTEKKTMVHSMKDLKILCFQRHLLCSMCFKVLKDIYIPFAFRSNQTDNLVFLA